MTTMGLSGELARWATLPAAFALIFVLDHLVAKPYWKARWFALHAFGNAFIMLSCLHGWYCTITDPFNSMSPNKYPESASPFAPGSVWPISLINVLHVYHLTFFELKPDDKFHHFLFIPLIGFPAQFWEWGAHRAFMCFFISGFPGGVDYFNLALVKQGKMGKMRQRKICASLNQWCRGPGILIASFLQYQSFVHGKSTAPSVALLMTATLAAYNALLYMGSSIRSHERALAIEKAEPTSSTVGMVGKKEKADAFTQGKADAKQDAYPIGK